MFSPWCWSTPAGPEGDLGPCCRVERFRHSPAANQRAGQPSVSSRTTRSRRKTECEQIKHTAGLQRRLIIWSKNPRISTFNSASVALRCVSQVKQARASQPWSSRYCRRSSWWVCSSSAGRPSAGPAFTWAPCSSSRATVSRQPWRAASSTGLQGSVLGLAPAVSRAAAALVFLAATAQYRAETRRSGNPAERSGESLLLTSNPDSISRLRTACWSCSAARWRGETPLRRTLVRLLTGSSEETILRNTPFHSSTNPSSITI